MSVMAGEYTGTPSLMYFLCRITVGTLIRPVYHLSSQNWIPSVIPTFLTELTALPKSFIAHSIYASTLECFPSCLIVSLFSKVSYLWSFFELKKCNIFPWRYKTNALLVEYLKESCSPAAHWPATYHVAYWLINSE